MADRRLNGAERMAAVAVVLIVLLQVGLPVSAVFEERPARYGWQMFSTVSEAPEVSVTGIDGSVTAVDPLSLMADPRAEVRWTERLIERLCRNPSTASVVVRERGETESASCR